MTVALGGVCVAGRKFRCSEYLTSTNTMFFFSIYTGTIAAGLCVPWTYPGHRQLLSMQHGVLLLIECMRFVPERDLPRVN
jgi:hypothetical protein